MTKYICDSCGKEFKIDTTEKQTSKTVALCDSCYSAHLSFELNADGEEQEFIDFANK